MAPKPRPAGQAAAAPADQHAHQDPTRPFTFHGLDLQPSGTNQLLGECPFCGKAKLYVSMDRGLYECKSCARKGNSTTFMRTLHELSDKATTDYGDLRRSRQLCNDDALMAWGAARSISTGEWVLPGFDPAGKMMQLYRYAQMAGGKMRLLATPGFGHQLHGDFPLPKHYDTVYVCEGPWDGTALWEVMRAAKVADEGAGLVFTGNPDVSLLGSAVVLATPGSSTFFGTWCQLLAGRRVVLLYDNDHPRQHAGNTVEGAGYAGVKRAVQVMARAGSEAPREVMYLEWGKDGYDRDLPDGHDVRDFLAAAGPDVRDRVDRLQQLLAKVVPVPGEWAGGGGTARGGSSLGPMNIPPRAGEVAPTTLPCESNRDLEMAWRNAVKLTDGFARTLTAMEAVTLSTELPGDQLWIKVVGPASCGKSTLCEAVGIATRYVRSISTIRGFHSGSRGPGGESRALIDELRNMTLITKDGDTLLTSPNLEQILAEARDLYDRVSRSHYRSGSGQDHSGVNMTWILCGTSSLRALDSSELGQRFLDIVMMDKIQETMEREINLRKLRSMQSLRLGGQRGGRDGETPEMVKAKRMTGGYVEYLRGNADRLYRAIHEEDEDVLHFISDLGEFTAHMRARPSEKQKEEVSREMSTRLVSTLHRMALCTAVALQRDSVDGEVMRRTVRHAVDTSRGRTLVLAGLLYRAGDKGAETRQLAAWTGETEKELRDVLKFLKDIEVAQLRETGGPLRVVPRWTLTPRLARLYGSVMGAAGLLQTAPQALAAVGAGEGGGDDLPPEAV